MLFLLKRGCQILTSSLHIFYPILINKARIMNRLFIKLTALAIVILLHSCGSLKNQTEDKHPELVQIRWEKLEEKDMLYTDDKIDSCRFLLLETNEKCLIGEIIKILVTDKHIFIIDNNKKLFVFDTNGKFLNTIGSIGPGPDEHLTISDFYVDEETGVVGVYDAYRTSITRYSFDGEIIDKTNCDPVLKNSRYILGINNGQLLISMINNINNDYHYNTVNERDGSLSGKYLPYLSQGTENLTLWPRTYSTDKTNHYVTTMFSDTLYFFANGELYPGFVLQTPLKKATREDIAKYGPYECGIDALPFLRRDGYSSGFSEIYAAGGYLHFTYMLKNNFYMVFWNIVENKGYYSLYKEFSNPLLRLPDFITTTSDAFMGVFRAFEVVEARETLSDPRLFKQIETVKEEDNPILAFYYILKNN